MTQAVEAVTGPEQAAEQQLTVRTLLEAGVHIGHPTKRWHPKMEPFIYQKRQKIHILNPIITLARIEDAAGFVTDLVAGGGEILFVGTKKQAENIISEQAVRCGSMYINRRWLGGLMTNFQTIQVRIDYLVRLEERLAKGQMSGGTKRERLRAATEVRRLNNYLGGIKSMTRLPDAIYVVDINKESIAIAEARRLNIKIVAMVDTNCDPSGIDYLIPSNDDASRAIALITRRISDAVVTGREQGRLAEEDRLAAETEIEELEARAREAAQAAAAARHAEAAPVPLSDPPKPEAQEAPEAPSAKAPSGDDADDQPAAAEEASPAVEATEAADVTAPDAPGAQDATGDDDAPEPAGDAATADGAATDDAASDDAGQAAGSSPEEPAKTEPEKTEPEKT